MDLKIVPFTDIKAGPAYDLAEGEFIGYASVFGNKDSYGDVVQPGAFADTLADWKASGAPVPVLWGHDMSDPFSNIGGTLSAEEDDHGLKVHARLDLENPKALQVYRLLKGRRVSQMSFAYDVLEGGPAKSEDVGDYYELRKLKLYEVSIVPIGANQETEILAVKARAQSLAEDVKAGRVLAQKHIDSLRAAQEAIGVVIAAAEANDQEKASGTAPAAKSDEEQLATVTPQEAPMSDPSVETLAALIQIKKRENHRG